MWGGSFLCFVILVNVCLILAAVAKDENGKTKKEGTNDTRHNLHRHRQQLNGNSFKPTLTRTKSQQQSNTGAVGPNVIRRKFANRQSRRSSRPNSVHTCSAIIRSPPPPDSGCCGIDITNLNRVPKSQNAFWNRPNPGANRRFLRDTRGDSASSNSYSDRIAGGKVTHFEEFPWTVLIKTSFFNGRIYSKLSCGGSIISSRFVLTAAHCIKAKENNIIAIEVYLSEFDKDTFPDDCEWVAGEGRRCIRNIRTDVDYSLVHPDYNVYDPLLENDIALIRLRKDAPYTRFIKPICLPPFDIDSPEYSDLSLTVAGWGLNSSSASQVKQSTVVHLIPQENCSADYFPQLSRGHLCAAGHSGEDACYGDSGGPLMMLYEGKYYVSGIMSGKRADIPCGTPNVPTMYTNVHRYLGWIKSNIT